MTCNFDQQWCTHTCYRLSRRWASPIPVVEQIQAHHWRSTIMKFSLVSCRSLKPVLKRFGFHRWEPTASRLKARPCPDLDSSGSTPQRSGSSQDSVIDRSSPTDMMIPNCVVNSGFLSLELIVERDEAVHPAYHSLPVVGCYLQ